MGYCTKFFGTIEIVPPLNKEEKIYLKNFNQALHHYTATGVSPYDVEFKKKTQHLNLLSNKPSRTCHWRPNKKGTALEWDGMEKFDYSAKWVVYLIAHFLQKNAYAKLIEPQKFNYLQGHLLNGTVYAKGEESNDIWKIVVDNNEVSIHEGTYKYPFNKKKLGENAYFDALYEHEIIWGKVKWQPSEKLFYEETPEDKIGIAKALKENLEQPNKCKPALKL